MKKILFLIVVLVPLCFSSCQKDEGKNEFGEVLNYSFVYNGVSYNAQFTKGADELPVAVNDAAKLFLQLDENPELATFVREDGMYEYFDHPEGAQKTINAVVGKYRNNSNGSIQRSAYTPNYIFYEHTRFAGRSLYPGNYTDLRICCDFDNKISSIASYALDNVSTITVYEHPNYAGKSMTIVCGLASIVDLRQYTMSGALFWATSWDNQISSMKINSPW